MRFEIITFLNQKVGEIDVQDQLRIINAQKILKNDIFEIFRKGMEFFYLQDNENVNQVPYREDAVKIINKMKDINLITLEVFEDELIEKGYLLKEII